MHEDKNSHNAVQYLYGEMPFRAVLLEGEPWFVANDVAKILGYQQTQGLVRRIDKRDFKKIKSSFLDGLIKRYANNDIVVINESGLYASFMACKKPEAEEFKHWVTNEVLPSIRKTGQYVIPQPVAELPANAPSNYPDAIIAYGMALKAKEALEAQVKVQSKVIEDIKPKAEFYDDALSVDDLITLSETCKELKIAARNEIGRNNLCRLLRDHKIFSDKFHYARYPNKAYTNEPYQRYVNLGYFVRRIVPGHRYIRQTFVTRKGLEFLFKYISELPLSTIVKYTSHVNAGKMLKDEHAKQLELFDAVEKKPVPPIKPPKGKSTKPKK